MECLSSNYTFLSNTFCHFLFIYRRLKFKKKYAVLKLGDLNQWIGKYITGRNNGPIHSNFYPIFISRD
jgi:hypothetical protein